jgi:hypothetical protein
MSITILANLTLENRFVCGKAILEYRGLVLKTGLLAWIEFSDAFIHTMEIEACTSFFQGCDIDADLKRQKHPGRFRKQIQL